jgi:hypothetical protein
MTYGTTNINYNGVNRGKIYLRDIGQRNGLGGGKGIYYGGQDRYINPGQLISLINTGDVMGSTKSGVIKKMLDLGSFTVTITEDSY